MRRSKLLLVLTGLAVVICAAGAVVLWPQSITPGLTQENFDRVQLGMTLPEVKALLGEPFWQNREGAHVKGTDSHPDWGTWWWRKEGKLTEKEYPGDFEPLVEIGFHNAGRVTWKRSTIFVVREDSALNNPLGWIRRQWRRWFPQ